MSDTLYVVRPYLKVSGELFTPHEATDQLGFYEDAIHVRARSVTEAAELVFSVGNRVSRDERGTVWRGDTRSLSVGDVLAVTRPDDFEWVLFLACESVGWREIPGLSKGAVVSLDGTVARSEVRGII